MVSSNVCIGLPLLLSSFNRIDLPFDPLILSLEFFFFSEDNDAVHMRKCRQFIQRTKVQKTKHIKFLTTTSHFTFCSTLYA